MKEFEVAIGNAAIKDAKTIKFKLGKDTLTAQPATTGQLALFLRSGSRGTGFSSVTALMEFVSDILDDKDWARVEDHLRDGLDINVLSEIVNYLIGEWSGRPTTPSSGSSSTRTAIGRRSTAKPRSTVKTSSRSPSTVSATSSNGG